MRFRTYRKDQKTGVAAQVGAEWRDIGETSLLELLSTDPDALKDASRYSGLPEIDVQTVQLLPPIPRPPKIICVGLNYLDHAAESPYKELPKYPSFFSRFATTLVSDGQPIIRPHLSEELDFEGELVAIIGRRGRYIPKEKALSHVAGYSIFNEASIRDYQFKSSQWTIGKNFDATGAFGPEFVTSDELPPGAAGLEIETKLNGSVVQQGNTGDLIYSVADLVSIASDTMTLEPGDVIVTGTPAGIGWARTPRLFMKDGDVCEVRIDGIGVLRNPIRDEDRTTLTQPNALLA